jgi:hypothetical protein
MFHLRFGPLIQDPQQDKHRASGWTVINGQSNLFDCLLI